MGLSSSIDPKKLFTAREAAELLDVTPDTAKSYCRNKKLKGRQIGPKREWHIPGSEIIRLRKEWNLD